MEHRRFDYNGKEFNVTISIGISTSDPGADTGPSICKASISLLGQIRPNMRP
jgi:hypothetical protein